MTKRTYGHTKSGKPIDDDLVGERSSGKLSDSISRRADSAPPRQEFRFPAGFVEVVAAAGAEQDQVASTFSVGPAPGSDLYPSSVE